MLPQSRSSDCAHCAFSSVENWAFEKKGEEGLMRIDAIVEKPNRKKNLQAVRKESQDRHPRKPQGLRHSSALSVSLCATRPRLRNRLRRMFFWSVASACYNSRYSLGLLRGVLTSMKRTAGPGWRNGRRWGLKCRFSQCQIFRRGKPLSLWR